jgi:hypothetical protein
MSLEQFVTFQKYNDLAAAMELALLLKENNIEYIMEDTSSSFDPSFANSELIKEFRIKLKQEDFEKADTFLQQIFKTEIDSVDKDYYLFSFTDEELLEIIIKRDEWGQFDFLLAQKLLKEHGNEVKPEEIESLRLDRIEELAKPEANQKAWISFGYILSFLGGALGIFIGWHLMRYKKTLPNGERVYAYSPADRNHGGKILIIGIICFLIVSTLRLLHFYNKSHGYMN